MTNLLDDKAIAARVLVALAAGRGRVLTLADVAATIDVRRADVRRVVRALHAEGFVDALRMRPTLAGLALAAALRTGKARQVRARAAVAAA